MIVKVEIKAGPNGHEPAKKDIQKNIDTLDKLIDNDSLPMFQTTSLIDTRSILRGIQEQLPEGKF